MGLLQGATYESYRSELLKRYKHLLRSLGNKLSPEKTKLVRDAFDMSARAHEGTVRKSGEPYIFHPLAVAEIAVSELGLGVTSVVCALLHDVVEDTDITLEDIEHRFGPKITSIIDGLTKISTVFEIVEKDQSIQAENFKKILLTLGEDLRVILIKLCDRLHNMRTLGAVSENTKLKIASETLFIYAPLAYRLGLNAIKTEMEDIALKFTNLAMYHEISEKLAETKNTRQRYIKEFIDPLKIELDKSGLHIVEIKGRPKSIYSIYQKMNKQQIPFEEVYDAFAIRVVVESPLYLEKTDCWKVYSIISDMYRSHTNRLRDWLSHPKSNGYSALHTTVLGPKRRWIEVQIRSKRMEDIAERGLAAHWRYKAGANQSISTPQDTAFENWLDSVKETLSNSDLSAMDLVSEFRSSLLGEEIHVFTPKGDVKGLPIGSTALDFAFSIHTEIGNRTIGAKVNNKLVSIKSVLKNGDIVEILTTIKDRVTRDWLEVVTTASAKSKIREALKAERTQKANQGKLLVERLFRKHQLNFNDSNIKKLISHFKYPLSAEFFHTVAEGQIRLNRELLFSIITKKILPIETIESPKIDTGNPRLKAKKNIAHIIIGEDHELPYALSKCCNPLPGDPIFGFVTVGEGIKIHRTTCPGATRLMSQYGYRIVSAGWQNDGYQKSFETSIAVKGIDDIGIVSRITDIISRDMEVNMKSINILSNEDGTFGGRIELMIYDLLHLEQLIEKIKATHRYIQVKRED